VLALDLADRSIGRVLARQAERVGDRPFLLFGGERFTYADVHAITNSYAEGFRQVGVQRGDHVALMLGNRPELVWALWGLGKLGAVAVPLNTAARGDLLVYLLDQSDSVLLVAEDSFDDRVRPAVERAPGIRDVLGPARLAGFADLPADDPPEMGTVGWDDPHLIMYTSGTTGPSKGVVCPHAQGHAVGLTMARRSGYVPDDVLYTCLPAFHANALWFTIYAALWADACVALSPAFSASRFWDEIRASGATVFNALGAMANIIWQLPRSDRDREHSVRIAMCVPSSPELAEGFGERYGIRMTSVFAMTENTAVTVLAPEDPVTKAGSAGRVRDDALGTAVQIVDDDHVPLTTGAVGEICVRPGRGAFMLGYHAMPEATVQATRDLWFHTGDRGHLDEDGYLFFADRKKEAIRRRGENISAYEVETVLCRHDTVHEAAAVPVPSQLGEDDVMVWVVPAAGREVDFAELTAFAVEQMAYYMVPRYLAVLEELPKTPSEKVEKYKLALRAREQLDALWDREEAGIEVKRP
jgi:crotonobetaine/carnitine-CoA ligase